MFDTVNMWIDSVSVEGGNTFSVLPFLAEQYERQSERGYCCGGKLGDYVVNCYPNGISLKGSLAKYYLPSNLFTLTRQQTKEALEQMSDQLHVDVMGAKINRLDISTVIPTQRPPIDYYCQLGDKAHFERVQCSKSTLYYNTLKKKLVFYDKRKEATAKGAIIPPSFYGLQNLLRYELRFTKELPRQLNTSTVTANMLFDSNWYYSIVQRWQKEFLTIKKINTCNNMKNEIKTPNEAKTAFFAMLLQQSGQMAIDTFLADLKANNTFTDKKYYSRLKSDLNKILQAPKGDKSELMVELERAINDVAKYAR